MTTIHISSETAKKLWEIKKDIPLVNMDEVIIHLLKNQKKETKS